MQHTNRCSFWGFSYASCFADWLLECGGHFSNVSSAVNLYSELSNELTCEKYLAVGLNGKYTGFCFLGVWRVVQRAICRSNVRVMCVCMDTCIYRFLRVYIYVVYVCIVIACEQGPATCHLSKVVCVWFTCIDVYVCVYTRVYSYVCVCIHMRVRV